MFIFIYKKKIKLKIERKKQTISITVIQIYGFIMRNDAVLNLIIAMFAMCCENAR